MVHPGFFGEDGGTSSHHSDLENQWLQVADYDEESGCFLRLLIFINLP